MTSAEDAVIDLALRLTGAPEFDSNNGWDITPPNWSCPVCKRSKMHIARLNQQNILQGHLHNHHDHIIDYAKDGAIRITNEHHLDKTLTEKEWWFIKEKIGGFLNRFDKVLICQDCNGADTKAKSVLNDICKYFTFTPNEISYFIKTEAHKPHKIDENKLHEICENLNDIHEYRKKLCDVLLSRSLLNDRMWALPQSAPNIQHYKAAKSILSNPDLYDGSSLLSLKNKSDTNLRYLSIAVEKHEKQKHERNTKSEDELWQEKQARKQRLKDKRAKTKKLVDEGVYFNHGELWNENDLKKLKELYNDGVEIEELAVKFGRMKKSIRSRLRKLGIKVE